MALFITEIGTFLISLSLTGLANGPVWFIGFVLSIEVGIANYLFIGVPEAGIIPS